MDSDDLARLRADYRDGDDGSCRNDDPVTWFSRWLDEAVAAGITEPNAMALATATRGGQPSVRIVLLKALDADGAVFYTNHCSRKGAELQENPRASAVMLWHSLQRQVRIEGPITQVSAQESDDYFASRPRGAQISALASPQSEVISNRQELERRVHEHDARWAEHDIVRPHYWGGYRLAMDRIEFWQGGADRLHDRIVFSREAGAWICQRLAP